RLSRRVAFHRTKRSTPGNPYFLPGVNSHRLWHVSTQSQMPDARACCETRADRGPKSPWKGSCSHEETSRGGGDSTRGRRCRGLLAWMVHRDRPGEGGGSSRCCKIQAGQGRLQQNSRREGQGVERGDCQPWEESRGADGR